MKSLLEMPLSARTYIVAVLLSGTALTFVGLTQWRIESAGQFAAYLLFATLASALKVNLPTITGTMSVNSLFILISIVQLGQGETMVIGLIGVLIQCLWVPKSRPLPVRVAFSVAANGLAISASYAVFQVPLLAHNMEGIRVLAVACTYFIVNTALVAVVVSLTERKSVAAIWKACYFWCFPYYLGGAAVAWLSTILNRRFDWQVSLALLPVIYLIYRSYKIYLQRMDEEKKHIEDMAGLHLRTIEALALAIEAKDHTTHDHLRRVRVYALELGIRMGLSPTELQSLRAAALLHDIGKLAVPEYIISKPGKLTRDEFEKMKIHPVVGAQILEQVKFPYPVAPIVLSHHEKWDGSGYPSGLKGTEIPIGARILSAVDALDALASDRQYRRALPLDQAMQMVAAQSGSTFDPAVILILESCYVELEQKALHEPHGSLRLDTEPIVKGGAPAAGFEQNGGMPALVDSVRENHNPLESAAHARQAIQKLYEWTRAADSTITLAETLAVFATRLRALVPHDSIAFYLKRGHYLIPEYVDGENQKLFSSLRIPWGEGLSGWVAENRKPILNGNPSVEAGYLNNPSKFSTLRSALAVPLETVNGVIGVMAVYRTERDAFSSGELRVLGASMMRIALAIEHSAVQPRSKEDQDLIRLPGTAQLFLRIADEVSNALLTGCSGFLAILDLDYFNEINRRFGRQSGDRALRTLAYGLRDFFGSEITVAYLGGDEFALLAPKTNQESLDGYLEGVRVCVERAGRQVSESFHLSSSIGVASFPIDGRDPETLLTAAETRLLCAKAAKRAKPEYAGLSMRTKVIASTSL